MTFRFRAIWPITAPRLSFTAMCEAAADDLPLLAAQAHARLTGPGRYTVARATEIPGSGRITEWVLIYEAPAVRRPPRRSTQPTRQENAA